MRTKCLVYLNGVGMHEISRDVVINSIDENAVTMQTATLASGTRVGQRVTARTRGYLEVDISFSLRNIKNYQRRADTLDAVNAWAMAGGEMEVNYRPDKRLRVTCDSLPAAGYMRDWTDEYTIAFRAYEIPFWEDARESAVTRTTAGETITIVRMGTAPTPLCFTCKNMGSGAADTASISAGGHTISFSGLGLAVGETLALDYDESGMQRIRILSQSGSARDAYDARTAESADDILLEKANESVTMRAAQRMEWRLSHRGRYL